MHSETVEDEKGRYGDVWNKTVHGQYPANLCSCNCTGDD